MLERKLKARVYYQGVLIAVSGIAIKFWVVNFFSFTSCYHLSGLSASNFHADWLQMIGYRQPRNSTTDHF